MRILKTAVGVQRSQVLLLAAVAIVALVVGFVVAQGPIPTLIVSAALCAAAWAVRPRVPGSKGDTQSLAFGLVLLSVLSMPSNALRLHENVTVSDAILVAAFAAFIGGLIVRIARRDPLPRIPAWLFIGTAGVALAAILVEIFPPDRASDIAVQVTSTSLYARNDPTTTAGDAASASNALIAARLTLTLLCVPLLLGSLGSSWRRLRMLLSAWLVGVAVNCIVAVLSALELVHAADIVGRDYVLLGGSGADRLVGLTVHPTQLGSMAAMAFPVVFMRLATRFRRGDVVLALLFMLGVLLSGTRAAILAVVAGIAVALLIQRGSRIRGGTIALVAVILVLVVAITNGAFFATVERLGTGSSSAATSDASHAQVYVDTFSAVIERPIVGYGFEVVRGGHNVYLELAHAGGLIALAGFLCILAGLFRTGFALVRDTHLPVLRRADATGLIGAIVAWVTLGIVQNSLYDRFLFIPAGLLIALAACARGAVASDASTAPAAPDARRTMPPVLLPRPAPGNR